MKPIFQTIVDKGAGDCERAAIASLFELDITQVPHFLLFDKMDNFLVSYNENELGRVCGSSIMWSFLRSLGWEFNGCGYPHNELELKDSVDGFFFASVKSRTYEGQTHAVVIDINGMVIHDPNPNKKWLGVNIKETGDILNWYLLSRKEKANEKPS
jgi:hypothetical protein